MSKARSIRKCAYVCALFAQFLFFAAAGFAQSDNGTINGSVKDPSGASIAGATVTVKDQNTGAERSVDSNNEGLYSITNIPPGSYNITVNGKGFKKFESSDNKLDPSSTLAVNATLQIGSATETVEVVASATTLQTETASVQKLITRQQIDALELNGRNPVGLASLVPGAHGGNLSGLSFNFSQGPSNYNGSRNPENLITYDGAPATRTRSNGTSLGAADVDSTSEVQILTAGYAAEYGRTSGAQIRIVTKAGGSDFHGAAYEYFRNNHLNANPGRVITPRANRTFLLSVTTSLATTSAARSTFRESSTKIRASTSGIGVRSGFATAIPTALPGLCPPHSCARVTSVNCSR